ncbi:Ig-like domain-containing protein [Pontibacillus sp. ALD_SL1]|uniref:Ig-like domain-containing protein n=1 Tax=Pontibacillus sp. ALD_SL1 TaxID=2777185 RepID=UPI001A972DD8|nr:Ig-like domain-containing protein [Pontibacillus sp. ALD_SL1]QSS99676.1 Ig-like domain-containing protein [Pontibacillus sp. ALD_SL1]
MRPFLRIFMLASIFALILIVPAQASTDIAKRWGQKTNVATDKSWTIIYNTPLQSTTENKQNIYVTDIDGSTIPTDVLIKGKKIIVSPLKGTYKPGTTYTLHINKGVSSTSRVKSSDSFSLPFTTKTTQVASSYFDESFLSQLEYGVLKGMEAGIGSSKKEVTEAEGRTLISRKSNSGTVLSFQGKYEEDYSYTLIDDVVTGASLSIADKSLHIEDLISVMGKKGLENKLDIPGHYTLAYPLNSERRLVAFLETTERSSPITHLFIMK